LDVKLQANEMEKIEEVIIEKYKKENPSDFNQLIPPLMEALSFEKQEGEKNQIFELRIFSELNKVFDINIS
jgi:hypothetical protein